ncbi:hypothetical protein TcWFU_006829 [Taenia crassiceps]|uniref:Uncharacterized protein n=1 Tax=Taenia crassiceps TaxID=6207 RepID=A0ABR4Q1M5_9CEST
MHKLLLNLAYLKQCHPQTCKKTRLNHIRQVQLTIDEAIRRNAPIPFPPTHLSTPLKLKLHSATTSAEAHRLDSLPASTDPRTWIEAVEKAVKGAPPRYDNTCHREDSWAANGYAGYEQMPEHTDVAEPATEAAAPTAAMQLLAQTSLDLDTMSKSDMEAATTQSTSATSSSTAQEISEKTTSKTSAISLHAPFLLLTTLLPSMH